MEKNNDTEKPSCSWRVWKFRHNRPSIVMIYTTTAYRLLLCAQRIYSIHSTVMETMKRITNRTLHLGKGFSAHLLLTSCILTFDLVSYIIFEQKQNRNNRCCRLKRLHNFSEAEKNGEDCVFECVCTSVDESRMIVFTLMQHEEYTTCCH